MNLLQRQNKLLQIGSLLAALVSSTLTYYSLVSPKLWIKFISSSSALVVTYFGYECTKCNQRTNSTVQVLEENFDQQMIFGQMESYDRVDKPELPSINIDKLMLDNYHFYGVDFPYFESVLNVMVNHLQSKFDATVLDMRGKSKSQKIESYPILNAFIDNETPTFIIDNQDFLRENLLEYNRNNCYLILINSTKSSIPNKFLDSATLHTEGINYDYRLVYKANNQIYKV